LYRDRPELDSSSEIVQSDYCISIYILYSFSLFWYCIQI